MYWVARVIQICHHWNVFGHSLDSQRRIRHQIASIRRRFLMEMLPGDNANAHWTLFIWCPGWILGQRVDDRVRGLEYVVFDRFVALILK